MAKIVVSDLSIDIPVYDVRNASLRKAILGRTVGGRFATDGSHVIVNALKAVSFEANDDDRIGIIGSNGSGKTTLLRVLAGIYPPSSGSVEIIGWVSSMLDPMLGMNSDATGIENIKICSKLWGLSAGEIENGVDDIASFTELGDYLNLPVRTYSTGMLLRLAFGIATQKNADILLLDEVIGVGDAIFFEKAFDRLHSLAKRSRILMVASHSDPIIRKLCNKAIWLDSGSVMAFGDVETVIAAYHQGAEAASSSGPAKEDVELA